MQFYINFILILKLISYLIFQAKLKIVTVFGAGLLVGTALTVIIPEGIRALYSDVLSQHNNPKPAAVTGATIEHHEHEEIEHSSTIGLSLVLGTFCF